MTIRNHTLMITLLMAGFLLISLIRIPATNADVFKADWSYDRRSPLGNTDNAIWNDWVKAGLVDGDNFMQLWLNAATPPDNLSLWTNGATVGKINLYDGHTFGTGLMNIENVRSRDTEVKYGQNILVNQHVIENKILQDSYISSEEPNKNFDSGDEEGYVVIASTVLNMVTKRKDVLLGWDPNIVPNLVAQYGQIYIESVILKIIAEAMQSSEEFTVLNVYGVSSFDESTVTWNNAPAKQDYITGTGLSKWASYPMPIYLDMTDAFKSSKAGGENKLWLRIEAGLNPEVMWNATYQAKEYAWDPNAGAILIITFYEVVPGPLGIDSLAFHTTPAMSSHSGAIDISDEGAWARGVKENGDVVRISSSTSTTAKITNINMREDGEIPSLGMWSCTNTWYSGTSYNGMVYRFENLPQQSRFTTVPNTDHVYAISSYDDSIRVMKWTERKWTAEYQPLPYIHFSEYLNSGMYFYDSSWNVRGYGNPFSSKSFSIPVNTKYIKLLGYNSLTIPHLNGYGNIPSSWIEDQYMVTFSDNSLTIAYGGYLIYDISAYWPWRETYRENKDVYVQGVNWVKLPDLPSSLENNVVFDAEIDSDNSSRVVVYVLPGNSSGNFYRGYVELAATKNFIGSWQSLATLTNDNYSELVIYWRDVWTVNDENAVYAYHSENNTWSYHSTFSKKTTLGRLGLVLLAFPDGDNRPWYLDWESKIWVTMQNDLPMVVSNLKQYTTLSKEESTIMLFETKIGAFGISYATKYLMRPLGDLKIQSWSLYENEWTSSLTGETNKVRYFKGTRTRTYEIYPTTQTCDFVLTYEIYVDQYYPHLWYSLSFETYGDFPRWQTGPLRLSTMIYGLVGQNVLLSHSLSTAWYGARASYEKLIWQYKPGYRYNQAVTAFQNLSLSGYLWDAEFFSHTLYPQAFVIGSDVIYDDLRGQLFQLSGAAQPALYEEFLENYNTNLVRSGKYRKGYWENPVSKVLNYDMTFRDEMPFIEYDTHTIMSASTFRIPQSGTVAYYRADWDETDYVYVSGIGWTVKGVTSVNDTQPVVLNGSENILQGAWRESKVAVDYMVKQFRGSGKGWFYFGDNTGKGLLLMGDFGGTGADKETVAGRYMWKNQGGATAYWIPEIPVYYTTPVTVSRRGTHLTHYDGTGLIDPVEVVSGGDEMPIREVFVKILSEGGYYNSVICVNLDSGWYTYSQVSGAIWQQLGPIEYSGNMSKVKGTWYSTIEVGKAVGRATAEVLTNAYAYTTVGGTWYRDIGEKVADEVPFKWYQISEGGINVTIKPLSRVTSNFYVIPITNFSPEKCAEYYTIYTQQSVIREISHASVNEIDGVRSFVTLTSSADIRIVLEPQTSSASTYYVHMTPPDGVSWKLTDKIYVFDGKCWGLARENIDFVFNNGRTEAAIKVKFASPAEIIVNPESLTRLLQAVPSETKIVGYTRNYMPDIRSTWHKLTLYDRENLTSLLTGVSRVVLGSESTTQWEILYGMTVPEGYYDLKVEVWSNDNNLLFDSKTYSTYLRADVSMTPITDWVLLGTDLNAETRRYDITFQRKYSVYNVSTMNKDNFLFRQAVPVEAGSQVRFWYGEDSSYVTVDTYQTVFTTLNVPARSTLSCGMDINYPSALKYELVKGGFVVRGMKIVREWTYQVTNQTSINLKDVALEVPIDAKITVAVWQDREIKSWSGSAGFEIPKLDGATTQEVKLYTAFDGGFLDFLYELLHLNIMGLPIIAWIVISLVALALISWLVLKLTWLGVVLICLPVPIIWWGGLTLV